MAVDYIVAHWLCCVHVSFGRALPYGMHMNQLANERVLTVITVTPKTWGMQNMKTWVCTRTPSPPRARANSPASEQDECTTRSGLSVGDSACLRHPRFVWYMVNVQTRRLRLIQPCVDGRAVAGYFTLLTLPDSAKYQWRLLLPTSKGSGSDKVLFCCRWERGRWEQVFPRYPLLSKYKEI